MIEDTLVHFKTKAAFDIELEAGNIKDTSVVFIDSPKLIYTHGVFHDGSTIDLSSFITADDAKAYTDNAIANLIDSAPETLDTLNELASAINDNLGAIQTLNNIASGKINLNGTVTEIVAMTQAEYDALTTKNATTLYIITD